MEFKLEQIELDVGTEAQTPRLQPRVGDDASAPRWLAERCGLPPVAVFPSLGSRLLQDPEAAGVVTAHIAWWVRHPNPGSRFEAVTRHLCQMPDAKLVSALQALGYDGLIYRRRGEIIGHVFFQRHGSDLCAFAAWVGAGRARRKFWAIFLLDFVALAAQMPDVTRARVGGGNHPITHHFVALLAPHAPALGWRVSSDGWVDFAAPAGT